MYVCVHIGDRAEEGVGHDGAAAQGHPAQVQQAAARALGNHQDSLYEYVETQHITHHTYIHTYIFTLYIYNIYFCTTYQIEPVPYWSFTH